MKRYKGEAMKCKKYTTACEQHDCSLCSHNPETHDDNGDRIVRLEDDYTPAERIMMILPDR